MRRDGVIAPYLCDYAADEIARRGDREGLGRHGEPPSRRLNFAVLMFPSAAKMAALHTLSDVKALVALM